MIFLYNKYFNNDDGNDEKKMSIDFSINEIEMNVQTNGWTHGQLNEESK